MFSVLKRKFGESLKARNYRLRVKAIKIKVILYNLSKLMDSFSVLILIEKFYKAELPLFYLTGSKPYNTDSAHGSG